MATKDGMADHVQRPLTTAENLALAVLRGDRDAIGPLVDHLADQYGGMTGAGARELPPITRFHVEDVDRLRAIMYVDDPEAVINYEDTRQAWSAWLRGESQVLVFQGVDRVELYELPQGVWAHQINPPPEPQPSGRPLVEALHEDYDREQHREQEMEDLREAWRTFQAGRFQNPTETTLSAQVPFIRPPQPQPPTPANRVLRTDNTGYPTFPQGVSDGVLDLASDTQILAQMMRRWPGSTASYEGSDGSRVDVPAEILFPSHALPHPTDRAHPPTDHAPIDYNTEGGT